MPTTDFDGLIVAAAAWSDVPELSTACVAKGGAGGSMNAPLVALVARTEFLAAAIAPPQSHLLGGLAAGSTLNVPAGVTSVLFEIWGGGAYVDPTSPWLANSGAHIAGFIPVAAGDVLAINGGTAGTPLSGHCDGKDTYITKNRVEILRAGGGLSLGGNNASTTSLAAGTYVIRPGQQSLGSINGTYVYAPPAIAHAGSVGSNTGNGGGFAGIVGSGSHTWGPGAGSVTFKY